MERKDRATYLVAMAAGSGTRMGSDTPKQFLDLCGEPILKRTLTLFREAVPSIRVVTVLPEAHMQWWRDYCSTSFTDLPQILAQGGMTRFHSVRNALTKVPDGAIVLIHDGVRPLVSAELIRSMLGRITRDDSCHAVVPVVPVTDTLKSLRHKAMGDKETFEPIDVAAPDRSLLWGAQTPQIFLSEELREAYSQPFNPSFTDDASVAASKKIPLTYVRGERFNLKLTTPEDLVLARAILEQRKISR